MGWQKGFLCSVIFLSLMSSLLASPGAWPVEHEWQDEMAPGKTYVDGYFEYAAKRAKEFYEAGTRLDCADLAITILVEFAYQHKLEVSFWFPAERKTVSCRDARFTGRGFKYFLWWSKAYVGAQNLADNTYAIPLEKSQPGDVVLFDWNQTPAWPDFPGRDVWHTYLIGAPGAKVIYYGNLDDGKALPVTMGDESTQKRIRTHPDRYGSGARRWKLFRKKRRQHTASTTRPSVNEGRPAREEPANVKELEKQGVVKVRTRLNIRQSPSTRSQILGTLKNGEKVRITGKWKNWYRIQLPNGQTGWIYGKYVRVKGAIHRLREVTSPRRNNQ